MELETTERAGVAVAPCWGGLEPLRDTLRRFLAQRCRDDSECEDIIQETFLRAARYRGSLTDPRRLRSWVLRIATNVLRDRAARGGRGGGEVLDEELCDATEGRESFPGDARDETWFSVDGEELDREAALGHLAEGLAELKPADRRILEAYYQGGESCAAAASRCGVSPHLVKVHLFRARRRLEFAMRQRVATARTRRLLGRLSPGGGSCAGGSS